ncbi:MAG: glucose-1-phosphate thymidylyltransferase [Bacteroidia bacterium]|nr:MAG: glucose-1-phosphate thymidylyltransferase [Bacteroidia bacterium]
MRCTQPEHPPCGPVVLNDWGMREVLFPLTYLRPVGDLRFGILPQAESWALALGAEATYYQTDQELRPIFRPLPGPGNTHPLQLNASVLPTLELVEAVRSLGIGQALRSGEVLLAARCDAPLEDPSRADSLERVDFGGEVLRVEAPWDIFKLAGRAMELDFARLTAGRASQPLSPTVNVLGTHRIFLEPGARAECCTLNATEGPIYLGRDSEVMEGSLVRGPFALGEHSVLRMGARVYGPTIIGPECRVGGEVSNVVFQGYANKAHEGFIGNAVIGQWCNLGADTNCSNLKNDYGRVRVWSVAQGRFVQTGEQFCGLIMGDHSKSGINTMFNTGTVVGMFCNVFGDGFPRTWVPSFSWGGAAGFSEHALPKALATARLVMARRGRELSAAEEALIGHLHGRFADRPGAF